MGVNFKVQGAPSINQSTCTGCGLCAEICPDRVLTLEEGKVQVGAGEFLGCIACGQCVSVCPPGASPSRDAA